MGVVVSYEFTLEARALSMPIKPTVSVQSCCACRLAARQASQRVLYSLRRRGNRTQLGPEGVIRRAQQIQMLLQVNTHLSTWAPDMQRFQLTYM